MAPDVLSGAFLFIHCSSPRRQASFLMLIAASFHNLIMARERAVMRGNRGNDDGEAFKQFGRSEGDFAHCRARNDA